MMTVITLTQKEYNATVDDTNNDDNAIWLVPTMMKTTMMET